MILKQVKGQWEWHSEYSWIDPYTKQETSYIAGFTTKEAAEQYGLRCRIREAQEREIKERV